LTLGLFGRDAGYLLAVDDGCEAGAVGTSLAVYQDRFWCVLQQGDELVRLLCGKSSGGDHAEVDMPYPKPLRCRRFIDVPWGVFRCAAQVDDGADPVGLRIVFYLRRTRLR